MTVREDWNSDFRKRRRSKKMKQGKRTAASKVKKARIIKIKDQASWLIFWDLRKKRK